MLLQTWINFYTLEFRLRNLFILPNLLEFKSTRTSFRFFYFLHRRSFIYWCWLYDIIIIIIESAQFTHTHSLSFSSLFLSFPFKVYLMQCFSCHKHQRFDLFSSDNLFFNTHPFSYSDDHTNWFPPLCPRHAMDCCASCATMHIWK